METELKEVQITKDGLKIEKYTYSSDACSIMLVHSFGAKFALLNETGDGENPFYVVSGGAYYSHTLSEALKGEKWEHVGKLFNSAKRSDDENEGGYWKVMFCDLDEKYYEPGVNLMSEWGIIDIYKRGDEFAFCV